MRALPLSDLDRLFALAERGTALLDRVRPVNGRAELHRVTAALAAGREVTPEWEYRGVPDLGGVIHALLTAAEALEGGDPWAMLYADRARELASEARLVLAVGSREFAAHAAARFPVDPSPAGRRAEAAARSWIAEPAEDRGEDRIAANDERDPRSLLSRVRQISSALRLPIRVLSSEDLGSAAATGDGLIVVHGGMRHLPAEALRIALHEVHGHALPRHRAESERLGLFSRGTAGGSEDEEGRALLIEERHGLLGSGRRRELSLRHLVALGVRQGADFLQSVRFARSFDVTIEVAVSIASRAHRGGGLAREIVYLPARERVKEAFAREPELEEWLARGRIGVAAARVLSRLGEPPGAISLFSRAQRVRNVATTGV